MAAEVEMLKSLSKVELLPTEVLTNVFGHLSYGELPAMRLVSNLIQMICLINCSICM
jgi:hypothetical protein